MKTADEMIEHDAMDDSDQTSAAQELIPMPTKPDNRNSAQLKRRIARLEHALRRLNIAAVVAVNGEDSSDIHPVTRALIHASNHAEKVLRS